MNHIKNFINYVKSYSKYVDFLIIIAYIALSMIGLVMVYSASMVPAEMNQGSSTYFYYRDLAFIILGFGIVFFMTYFMSGNFFKMKGVQILMIVTIIILLWQLRFLGQRLTDNEID